MCKECKNEVKENGKQEKVRKVFLDDLPRKNGKYRKIDWKKCKNYIVKGVYDGLNFEVEIVDYKPKGQYLYIKYKDKDKFKIMTSNFMDCKLSNLLKQELYTYIYDENNSRRVDLRDLPLNGFGIDWVQVANNKMKIPFVYEDIEGEVEVVDYDIKNYTLYIKFKDKEILKIKTNNFHKCNLGKLLGRVTGEFKVQIGSIFKNDKRDITIINREYRENKNERKFKWYQYHCNRCDWDEGWIEESNLLQGYGCSCCGNRTAVLGINTIWDTDRWMCDLGVSEEDAKKYTSQSSKKVIITCPDCGRIKKDKISIYSIYHNHSIGCSCSDGQSYPFKLCFALLEQLKINFKTEYAPKWCKFLFNGKTRKGRYDFYFELNDKKYIIEMDGGLGHGKKVYSKSKLTVEETKEIDDYKDKLADEHGINVIRIDSDISDLEYIKNNILNSKLNNLFDLSIVNWNLAEEFAFSNLVKKICEIKRDNSDLSTTEIGNIMNLNRTTIRSYLKQGTKIWDWVNYNSKEEILKNYKNCSKQVEVFRDGVSIGVFKSMAEIVKQFEKTFGIKLYDGAISAVCKGKQKTHKGFEFKYSN